MANLISESPVIQSGFSSPDIGKIESSSSRRLPSPRFLHDPSPSTLLPLLEAARIGVDEDGGKGKGNDLRTRLILRHALQWGVERGDVELVAWLISLPGEWVSLIRIPHYTFPKTLPEARNAEAVCLRQVVMVY